MTTKNRERLALVAKMPCRVAGCTNPANVHHVRRHGEKRDDQRTIPLCRVHHQTGPRGVAIHAGRTTWERIHGTEAEHLAAVNEILAKGE